MQPDAEKAVVVDGLEKIALMAVCIFVVHMWSLQKIKSDCRHIADQLNWILPQSKTLLNLLRSLTN